MDQKSDQVTGKFLAGKIAESQPDSYLARWMFDDKDLWPRTCTLPGYEPEAGAWGADDAKDYAAETIERKLASHKTLLAVTLMNSGMKIIDEVYALENADLLLNMDHWLRAKEGRGDHRQQSWSLYDLAREADCISAECYGQHPAFDSGSQFLYAYRFFWSPFSQSALTPQGRSLSQYPEFPIVQDGKFKTVAEFPNLYADPVDAAKRRVMRMVANYNLMTQRHG